MLVQRYQDSNNNKWNHLAFITDGHSEETLQPEDWTQRMNLTVLLRRGNQGEDAEAQDHVKISVNESHDLIQTGRFGSKRCRYARQLGERCNTEFSCVWESKSMQSSDLYPDCNTKREHVSRPWISSLYLPYVSYSHQRLHFSLKRSMNEGRLKTFAQQRMCQTKKLENWDFRLTSGNHWSRFLRPVCRRRFFLSRGGRRPHGAAAAHWRGQRQRYRYVNKGSQIELNDWTNTDGHKTYSQSQVSWA